MRWLTGLAWPDVGTKATTTILLYQKKRAPLPLGLLRSLSGNAGQWSLGDGPQGFWVPQEMLWNG